VPGSGGGSGLARIDSAGSRVAVASRNGMVWIWSTTTAELESAFLADTASPDRTFDLAFDPRGR